SDWYVELTPKGDKVWEWHFDRHVDEITPLVPVKLPSPVQDWAHTNTVEVMPETPLSKKDKRFKEGNILFSMRNIDTIGVIDREKKKVVWAWGPGNLDRQHMPTMLPSGHILIYDNGSHRGHTRIIELDPLSEKIVWEYKADPPKSFLSPTRGSNQRLPNGNTFIAESDSGRLFEVTPDGEIVWEFLNPDRTKNGRRMPLYRSIRYTKEEVEKLLPPAR
ncbi:aryl-sulfate sulfotransferase, partial [bacterium]|nr:aryl-sulfate sulfotransferase [bacterium]